MTKAEELYEEFKALTPKERNERLQALFAARLAERPGIDDFGIDLFKALIKSFNVSVKFEELDNTEEGEAF